MAVGANCWLMLRQPTEAIADYTRALELDPEDVASYRYRAQVYEDKAQFGAAIADLDRAINLAEDDADLYAQRRKCSISSASAAAPSPISAPPSP